LPRFILFLLLSLASTPAATRVSAVDDRGILVALARPADAVVAISPHLAELAFDAGAGDKLVAVVRGTDYPAAAAALPTVGDAAGLDFERIAKLRPDLVLAWGSGNRTADIEQLNAMGLTVFVAEPRRLLDIPQHLRAVGLLTGRLAAAEVGAAAFERRLAALRSRYAGAAPRSVFVEIWRQPLFTVGGRHLVSDALRVCGAGNAMAELAADAAPVPLEWLLGRDPDAIVSALGETQERARRAWSAYPRLSAVAAGAVVSVPPEELVRATPRILDGIDRVCAALSTTAARPRPQVRTH
jgi:iron complex transport system substrate-binding protein